MPHQCTSCARRFTDGSKEMLSGCPDCGGSTFQFLPDGGTPAAEEPPSPPDRGAGTVTETVGHVATKLRDFVDDDPGQATRQPARGSNGATTAASTARVEDGPSASADLAEKPSEEAVADGPSEEAPGQGTTTEQPVDERADESVDERADESVEDGDADSPSPEDSAQSTARSEMVRPEELPDGHPAAGTEVDREVQPAGDQNAEAEGRIADTPGQETPDLAELRAELNDQFEGIRICEPGQYELNLMELYEREETIIALQENGRYVIEPPESWHGDGRA